MSPWCMITMSAPATHNSFFAKHEILIKRDNTHQFLCCVFLNLGVLIWFLVITKNRLTEDNWCQCINTAGPVEFSGLIWRCLPRMRQQIPVVGSWLAMVDSQPCGFKAEGLMEIQFVWETLGNMMVLGSKMIR